MKKLLILLALVYFNVCFAQTIIGVKVYISNPYVERVNAIKTQIYNSRQPRLFDGKKLCGPSL